MDNANIKKVAAVLLLLSATPSLFAEERYVGLGVGPEIANFKQHAVIIGGPPSTTLRIIDINRFSAKGTSLSLFGGIGFRFPMCNSNCDRIYFGIEANANIRNLIHKRTNRELIHLEFNHTYYKMHRGDFGISFLPGVLVSDCSLFYARLGYAHGRLKVDTTDISLQNKSGSLNGVRYGLGLRQGLNECLAFRLEYGQTHYQKIKMFTFDRANNVAKTTHIRPYVQRFELGLLFNF